MYAISSQLLYQSFINSLQQMINKNIAFDNKQILFNMVIEKYTNVNENIDKPLKYSKIINENKV